ncbi:hypothetical protein MW887_004640 [Aspergillus wentii]|nr:hypothetical protein MW887_004640 [Aspergillus wentii]
MASKNFKVIIAGGSIAGLSLALMLEKNGIDYVILEGYPSIAPQVGAGLGVLPNGLRVLDQLGCYEAVMEIAEHPIDSFYMRDSQARKFYSYEALGKNCIEGHGYPIVFIDRRMLIQILYDKIEDKSKVHTSERVASVVNSDSHVTVTTEGGKSYTGDIVVGADGVHSTVRQEMWKEANKSDPTWIDPAEKEAPPATYTCLFAISRGVQGLDKHSITSVLNEGFSHFVVDGPGDRTYWGLFQNIGKTVHGSEIPRFTKEDEKKLAKEHWNDRITPDARFSDLYENKIASVYTSLPEYVYKKWYFQRIMTIGDSSHKFHPLTGQGGNNCIETAASLTNHLIAALKKSPYHSLSTAETSSIFEKVQRQREDRVSGLIKDCHARQRLEALETPLMKLIAKYVLPYMSHQTVQQGLSKAYCPSVSLDMLPMPNRPRSIPYHDELLRKPTTRGYIQTLIYAAFILMAYAAHRLLFVAGDTNGTWSLVRDSLQAKSIIEMDTPLRQVYTGAKGIDMLLQTLITLFLPVVQSPSTPEQPLQLLYFLSAVLPLIAIIMVEAYRQRNSWTLLASPILWGVAFQLRGIGFIAPIYFLVTAFTSRQKTYFLPTSRSVSTLSAKAILPALLLGYVIPTMLMFFPIGDTSTRQAIFAMWQPSPVVVVILTEIFSRAIGWMDTSEQKNDSETSKNNDLPHLASIYKGTGVTAACLHLTVVFACLVSDNLSLTRLFLPQDSFAPVKTVAEGAFVFFQNDFLVCALAAFLGSWVSVCDMYRVGVSNVGATIAAVWYWREYKMVHKDSIKG